MAETWVVNASLLIVLAKAGQLSLLEQLPDEFLIPQPVVAEILDGPEDDPARRALTSGWGPRAAHAGVPARVLEWGLGAGESAVLAAALDLTSAAGAPVTAVLDDMAARRAAKAMDVPVIGTLGIILRAKQRGVIMAVRAVIDQIRAAGLFLDAATVDAVLKHVGE